MYQVSEEEKWRTPFNISYPTYKKIICGLFQKKADQEPVGYQDLADTVGVKKETISSNLSFLKAIGATGGDGRNGFSLTEKGAKYAKAVFEDSDPNIIKQTSEELIENSHLKDLSDFIKINENDLTEEKLYKFIKGKGRYPDGPGTTGMSAPNAAGSTTLLNIFYNAGLLPESIMDSILQKKKYVGKTKEKRIPKKNFISEAQHEEPPTLDSSFQKLETANLRLYLKNDMDKEAFEHTRNLINIQLDFAEKMINQKSNINNNSDAE